jgi:L-iditol 2-dehydrogenase
MKKVVLTGVQKFGIVDVPKPLIQKDNDVLLKVISVGVCGSDIHYYNEGKIGDQVIKFPFTIGHECSAIVEAAGKNVKKIKEGELVAVEPALSCHQCDQCRNGREHTCLNQKFLGCPGQAEGCLAEYIIMPERNCFPVPGNIDPETAALIEPLTIGYYASGLAGKYYNNSDRSNIKAAILGAGPIGLSVLLSLKTLGIHEVYVTDLLDYRLHAAQKAGAVWTGNSHKTDTTGELLNITKHGLDLVFECCGEQEALDQAVDILKPGGTLLIAGIPETDRVSFDISRIRRKELIIQNVRRQNNSTQSTIDLTASGKWSPGFMITHRYTPAQTSEAFNTVANYKDGVIKAMINFL